MEQNAKKNKWRNFVSSKFHKSSLIWLWRAAGKYKVCIAVLLLLEVVFGLCSVYLALLFRGLVDNAVAGNLYNFLKVAVQLAALLLAEMFLGAFDSFMTEWTHTTLSNQLKLYVFSNILHKDYATITATHSGEWVNRLTSDTGVVSGGIIDILPSLAGMLTRLAGALVVLFLLEPMFFYILIPVGFLIIFATASLRKILKRMHKKIQEAKGKVLAFFQERLESLMIIRVFSMEEQTYREASIKLEGYKHERLKRNHFSNFCNFGFGAIANGGYLFSAVYCGYGILQGTISYGTFTAILQLVGQVQSPLAGITGIVPQYYAMIASAERLIEVENYTNDENERHIPADEISRFYREEFQGIEIQNASFSYPSSEEKMAVINHFDLEIRKGECIAFTGHSGCGKSTLLKLLMCLYPLNAGKILIQASKDGDAFEYPMTAAWRGLFAYVPQGNQLMSGTIREIVAFGDPQSMGEDERMKKALRIACADEFVASLERGIDTPLGEHGAGLSEGQMQRIAIARAIFSNRPLLILDESTSSLDKSTEEKLLTNLRQMTDKTVLIITHRSAALKICDRKVAMEKQKARAL